MNHYFIALLAVLSAPTLHAATLDDPFGSLEGVAPTPCRREQTAGLSVADAVDLALCVNPQTREVWANARYQAAQVGIARSALLPTLSANLSANQYSGSAFKREQSANLALSWLVFDFGGRDATLESARQLFAAASASRDSTVQSVFQSTVQAYYQVHANEAALAAVRKSEQSYQESYKAAEARHQVGAATPADKLQAQTAYSQASLVRIQAEGALRAAQGGLAAIMGQDAHRPLSLAAAPTVTPGAEFEQDVEALIATARELRPDLFAAEAQVRAAEADVAAASAAGMPTLSLGLAAGKSRIDGSAWDNNSYLGLAVTIPIFTGFSTTYKIKAAEAQREAKAASRDSLRLQVALDVWNAYQSLVTANQSLRSSADLLASAEQSEQVAVGRYKGGVGSILDLLSAQSALAAARLQRVRALFNWNVSRTALAFAVGNLDTNLLSRLAETITNTTNAVTKP